MTKGVKRSSNIWSPEQENNAETKERQVKLHTPSIMILMLDTQRLISWVIFELFIFGDQPNRCCRHLTVFR